MKNIIPFIPIFGLIIAFYYAVIKKESVGLDKLYISIPSALLQALSIIYIINHIH